MYAEPNAITPSAAGAAIKSTWGCQNIPGSIARVRPPACFVCPSTTTVAATRYTLSATAITAPAKPSTR